ncbi:hypothetical protein DSM43518_03495 [Mycobacterium marinum]|nr:hypothetical protein DSM43518_03495 [Mycobacterium marinum]RFZ31779.1 hypothetical protein KST_04736 [Mycobacterium marinum]RFZ42398.1 hypothetical protein MSS4_04790 [Mycobacterium marinum]CDM77560.1 hypothetical protein MMARE11_34190 [Mycobacterium marinum E11]
MPISTISTLDRVEDYLNGLMDDASPSSFPFDEDIFVGPRNASPNWTMC